MKKNNNKYSFTGKTYNRLGRDELSRGTKNKRTHIKEKLNKPNKP